MLKDIISYKLEKKIEWKSFQDYSRNYLAIEHDYKGILDTSGTNDGGADAINYFSKIICAISIQKDWKKKLKDDANRVNSEKNMLYLDGIDEFLFVTNQDVGPYRKLANEHKKQFGWELKIFSLSSLVDGAMKHLELRKLLGVMDDDFLHQEAKEAIQNLELDLIETEEVKKLIDKTFSIQPVGELGDVSLRFRLTNNMGLNLIIKEIILENKIPLEITDAKWTILKSTGFNKEKRLDGLRYKYGGIENSEVTNNNYIEIFYSLPNIVKNENFYDLTHKFSINIEVASVELESKFDFKGRFEKEFFFKIEKNT